MQEGASEYKQRLHAEKWVFFGENLNLSGTKAEHCASEQEKCEENRRVFTHRGGYCGIIKAKDGQTAPVF